MPFGTIKLLPGVNTTKTPVLNEAGISASQLIRFKDGLVQKYGGWEKFFSGIIPGNMKALHAWEGINSDTYLGVGSTTVLATINDGDYKDLTPQTTLVNIPVDLSTTLGSDQVTVTDVGRNASAYDIAYFNTPISVGGLIIQGAYSINPGGADAYTITADAEATSTVANGGAVPEFSVSSGASNVVVTLNDHGLSVGDTFVFLASTTVGGVTIQGQYLVIAVGGANTFTINANKSANATTTAFMNSGDAQILYYIGIGPQPPGTGYGIGGYGRGGYGTGNPPVTNTGTPITATDWSLDNWGNILVASPKGSGIFLWSPDSGYTNAQILVNAPEVNGGCFVAMPQRQIIAWASTFNGVQDPLLVRWCDIENYDVWVASTTNSAGSYRIPTGSQIVGAMQAPQQGLIWTDIDLWSMQFIGGLEVYGFNKISSGCGLIAQYGATMLGTGIYWMSQKQFFMMIGNGVQQLPCPVWDVIFQNLDTTNLSKIRAGSNSQFNEVMWFYPSLNGGGVVDSYVKYNVLEGTWDYGNLGRVAWIDQSVLGSPIASGTDGYIYQHEMGNNADLNAMTASFETGYAQISEAEEMLFVDWILPDMKWGFYDAAQTASVQVTFYVTNYAGQTPTAYGPYTMTQSTEYIGVRFRGRFISTKIESSDVNSFWRLGGIKYRFARDGRN